MGKKEERKKGRKCLIWFILCIVTLWAQILQGDFLWSALWLLWKAPTTEDLVSTTMSWHGGCALTQSSQLFPWLPTSSILLIKSSFFKKKTLTPWFFFLKFIYFWLCWVFIAARRLSLVGVSRGYSSLQCAGLALWWLLFLRSTGSRRVGFSSCSTWAQ